MKNKILVGVMLLFVVTMTAWNVNQGFKSNRSANMAFVDLDAIADGENTQEGGGEKDADNKDKYKSGHVNQSKSCEIKEVYECEIGFTIPNWVPYIGGTTCSITYQDEIKFPGTINECIYTGVPEQSCDYYRCQKNT